MTVIAMQMPRKRVRPADDMTGWSFHVPGQTTWSWEFDPDYDIERVQATTYVRHASGRRTVVATCDLSQLLDSLVATKVGRAALLAALLRHEQPDDGG